MPCGLSACSLVTEGLGPHILATLQDLSAGGDGRIPPLREGREQVSISHDPVSTGPVKNKALPLNKWFNFISKLYKRP